MRLPVRPATTPSSERLRSRTHRDPGRLRILGPATRLLHEAITAEGEVRPRSPSLVSSTEGAIREILITVPTRVGNGTTRIGAAYQKLLRTLPDETRVLVYVSEKQAADVRAWLRDAGKLADAVVIETDDATDFTMWAEDPYAVAESDGYTYLVEPWNFRRSADALIADQISHATSLRSTQTPLYFEGGNILVGADEVLIGFDYAQETARAAPIVSPSGQPSTDEVRALFASFLDTNRKILFPRARKQTPAPSIDIVKIDGAEWAEVKNTGAGIWQPIFHIDMFITLAGHRAGEPPRALVGDPRLATQLVPDIPTSALAGSYDQIAEFLRQTGHEVTRLPLAEIYQDWGPTNPMARDDIERDYGHHKGARAVLRWMDRQNKESMPLRLWYVASWNNALVQHDGDGKGAVWMPEYGFAPWPELAALDRESAAIWGRLGFNVHGLGDFHDFATLQGAAHCITKYLSRGPA